nr:hypothetical protein [Tanacetum cinerariifolium]
MQALKESKKTSRRQPGTGGTDEETSSKPGVPNESTVVFATSSEGTGIKPGVPDEEKDITKEKDDKDGDADDEGDDHISDTQDADVEDVETKSDEDDIYKYKIRVCKDEDEEMMKAEVDDSDKGDEKITNAVKADAKKISKVKDDLKKAELPPSSSSISISSGFDDQFLKLSSNFSLVSTVNDRTDSEINSLVKVKIQSKVLHTHYYNNTTSSIFSTIPYVPQQTTTPISTPPTTTNAQIITIDVPESNALTAVKLRVVKLEKDMSELKTVDHSTEALAILKEQAEKQQTPKFTIKSTNKVTLKEYSALYQSMHANKSFNRNLANHRLYHALMKALIEDKNTMDKGVANTVKYHKRKHDDDEDDDDEDHPARPNKGNKTKGRITKESESSMNPSTTKETPKGKAPSKGSKTYKSTPTKELVEEPIAKVVMDDAENLTQDILLGPTFNLLKGTFSSSIKLEYNFQECFNALTEKLDWNNPEGDRCPFDLSKPLPLQGPPGHQTVAADYFFNNDLEYLKTSDLEVTYTSSIMKTKAARYEIKGIEDMVPTLWSIIKHAYDKDVEKGIKH